MSDTEHHCRVKSSTHTHFSVCFVPPLDLGVGQVELCSQQQALLAEVFVLLEATLQCLELVISEGSLSFALLATNLLVGLTGVTTLALCSLLSGLVVVRGCI